MFMPGRKNRNPGGLPPCVAPDVPKRECEFALDAIQPNVTWVLDEKKKRPTVA
jgi:hypothetical protein